MTKEHEKNDLVKNWYQKRYFRNLLVLILIFSAIFLASVALPIIDNVWSFFASILLPFFLSLILYYFVRPVVHLLTKKISIYLAIAIVYLLLAGLLIFVIIFLYPRIADEIKLLRGFDFESIIKNVYRVMGFFKGVSIDVATEEQVRNYMNNFLEKVNQFMLSNFVGFVTSLTEIFFDICVVPLILFYLLKDDKVIFEKFCNMIPKRYLNEVKSFLSEVDAALSHFISARVIVSGIISIILFFTFLGIGINYYYILALVSFIFYIIPTIGWTLASILPLVIGFSMSVEMGVEALIICLLAASLEGFWLTPEIMGHRLTIHPLTIILILIISGYLFGFIGMLFVTPFYAVLKILAAHLYRNFYKLDLD